MKILLVKHPTVHFRHTAPPVSGLPLGLLYVASSLEKAGHQVCIYDAIVDTPKKRRRSTEAGGYTRLGAGWDRIQKVIEKFQPDAVGIGNQYSSQAPSAIKTAEVIKQFDRTLPVIVGGPHASVMPSTFLYPASPIDYAVLGEGELTTVELIDCLNGRRDIREVKGIAYCAEGKLVINQRRDFIDDLDQLPLPAYGLIDLEKYFYFNKENFDGRERYQYPGSERSVSMITSRGCPFGCIFCSIRLVMGKRFRAHSASFVLEHLRMLKDKFGVKHVHFEDDNLSFDMSRFNDILDGMHTRAFRLTWDTPNGVRADYLTEDILRRCKVSGCTYLRIGVESADEQVSKNIIGKRLDAGSILAAARTCVQVGIDLEGFYIIGFPGEKISQMKKTVDFALKQARQYGMYPYDIFTATPLIGTELYEQCLKQGYLFSDVSPEKLATATQGEGVIATVDFKPADLKKLLRFFRLKRYLAMTFYFFGFLKAHPEYIWRLARRRFFVRQQLALIRSRRLFDFLEGIFMYRYKNCVLRKV